MMDNTETTPARLEQSYRERRHLRWDPTVNMGHMISAGAGLVAALTFAIGTYIIINTRVVVLEEAKNYQVQRDIAQDNRIQEMSKDLKDSMQEIKTSVNELRRDVRAVK